MLKIVTISLRFFIFCGRIDINCIMVGELMELMIFHKILKDDAVLAIIENDYSKALKYIIEFCETKSVTKMAVKEYIASLLTEEDNILSYLEEQQMAVGDDLYRAALTDMQEIYNLFFEAPLKYVPSGNKVSYSNKYIASIKRITESRSAEELLENVRIHYRTLGCGELSKFAAFKYADTIKGVIEDGSVTLDSLVGLEYQKEILLSNTKNFVLGLGGNNVLLFGDRGTGKSSSVKALLNEFKDMGLRMIEIPKNKISEIPELINYLASKPNKYILFLDDLTFETHDSEYRALKIAMDGQLASHPDNVLIYATSNRRHLIKENWEDRNGGEVHVNDNMQETLSLSERFGISLVFSSPNQAEYLNVVRELLKREGIEPDAEIEKKAVVWQMNYGGRNPRLAKQFVADFVARNK